MTRPFIALGVLLSLLPTHRVFGSNANIDLVQSITLKNGDTISCYIQDSVDPAKEIQYYYLPARLQFLKGPVGRDANGKEIIEEMITVRRYNLPNTRGAWQQGVWNPTAAAGGTLDMVLTFGLDAESEGYLQTQLRQRTGKPAATASAMPLDRATVELTYKFIGGKTVKLPA